METITDSCARRNFPDPPSSIRKRAAAERKAVSIGDRSSFRRRALVPATWRRSAQMTHPPPSRSRNTEQRRETSPTRWSERPPAAATTPSAQLSSYLVSSRQSKNRWEYFKKRRQGGILLLGEKKIFSLRWNLLVRVVGKWCQKTKNERPRKSGCVHRRDAVGVLRHHLSGGKHHVGTVKSSAFIFRRRDQDPGKFL